MYLSKIGAELQSLTNLALAAHSRAVKEIPEFHRSERGGSWQNWPDRETGPWRMRLDWLEVGGRLECVGLTLEAADHESPTPLTTTVLRSIPLPQLVRDGSVGRRRLLAGFAGKEGQVTETDWVPPFSNRREAHLSARGPGRKVEITEDFLKEVAEVYNEAFRARHAPTAAVAQAFFKSHSAASKWVAAARAAGLLAPTSKGRARGTDTQTRGE